ncbi:ABC transporter substrate-binding protein [Streptomyces sp. TRM66268-LWL]|uniref:ABC transporter substrate-binding protein n=1 Tax=Streptomyces polyasparticus TaxID=2767826 RepID=A0ABR7SDH4_9ACTN|nr:ABC transporter substrate-binding protein [Streptomyces polyasparticus]MBC9713541.1 ABC transporter substrate-binding protein [Streptomyces polyasparticus]
MRPTRTLAAAVVVALAWTATACSETKRKDDDNNPTQSAGPRKKGGEVTIANTAGQTWTCNFNPFNPAVYNTSIGFVYEPLVFVNALKDAAETPMLAKSYQWNADKTQIDFTIREGVKWNDGKPFTAKDVAFTFNLMKEHPPIDLYALWTTAGLQSVTASGDKVTLKFKEAAQPYFYAFANQQPIVPEHVFGAGEAQSKPETWVDKKPVGTGPFEVDPCSPNNIQYTANAEYWQQGKPYIQKVQYPAYLDNAPANLDLASGKAQWGSQFIPGIEQFYLGKSKDNHTWSPPVLNVGIYPNLDPSKKTSSNKKVRQAISYAIDREQVAKIGVGGQVPVANQSGVVIPTFDKYYDAAAVQKAGFDKPDPDRAKELLSELGYSPSKPLKLTILSITGYTDWDASLKVIKQNLKAVGIDLTVQTLAQQTFVGRLYTGDYDFAYYNQQTSGPSPYYELRQMLHSANTAPLGENAPSNFERYKNPQVDALLNEYAAADEGRQAEIVKEVSQFMLDDVPVIPVVCAVDWYQYNTEDIAGWPTEENPYAQPAAYNFPDNGQVLANIYSKSAQ